MTDGGLIIVDTQLSLLIHASRNDGVEMKALHAR